MYSQFKSYLFTISFLVITGVSTTAFRSEAIQSAKPDTMVMVSGLTVTKTSATSVGLSWDSWPGSGDYTVSVQNLTTSQLEQQFTTSSTFASVSSLTSGHTYRFSVDKAGYVITEDVIM